MFEIWVKRSGFPCRIMALCATEELANKVIETWKYANAERVDVRVNTIPFVSDDCDVMSLRPHYVYAVRMGNGGPVKIGVTSDCESRLRDISTHSPEQPRLLALEGPMGKEQAFSQEKHIKDKFSHCRVSGEWFDLADETFQLRVKVLRDCSWDNFSALSALNDDELFLTSNLEKRNSIGASK